MCSAQQIWVRWKQQVDKNKDEEKSIINANRICMDGSDPCKPNILMGDEKRHWRGQGCSYKQTIIFPFPSLGPDSAAREVRLPRVRLLMVVLQLRQMTRVRETGHCSHHTSVMCSIYISNGSLMWRCDWNTWDANASNSWQHWPHLESVGRQEKSVTYWVAK